jgi:hypothetical protein
MKTFNRIIFLAALLAGIISIRSYAQTVLFKQWSYIYDNPGYQDKINKFVVDGQGSTYITGVRGEYPASLPFIAKLDQNGMLQFSKIFQPLYYNSSTGFFGASGQSIAVDNSGNIYMAGYTDSGYVKMKPFIVKYNSSGDTLWARYSGIGDSLGGGWGDIKLDNSGNIYTAGMCRTGNNYYLMTAKYNSSGALLWKKTYSPAMPYGGSDIMYNTSKLCIDNSGNIIVSGSFGTTYNLDTYDIIAAKYDGSGNLLWVNTYNGGNADQMTSIVLDNSGNPVLLGTKTIPPSNKDIICIKFDGMTGANQWTYTIGGTTLTSMDIAGDITISPANDVYFTGTLFDFYYDAVVVKLNQNGAEQWKKRYSGNYSKEFFGIIAPADGNIYLTGMFNSYGVYTAKYNSTGDLLNSTTYHNPGNYEGGKFIAMGPNNSIYCAGNDYATGNTAKTFLVKYLQVMPQTTTVCRSINKPIRDFTDTYDTLNISGLPAGAQILDIHFRIDSLSHTYIHNLVGTLRGPTGLTDSLLKRPGKNVPGINILGCNITDTASKPLDSAVAPATGYFRPYRSFSGFAGSNPNGQWIFKLYDTQTGDTGSLRKYCITINYFDPSTIGIQTISNETPKQYMLSQNYPNPFNPVTNIKFSIPKSGNVTLKVYDILGRQVTELVNEYKPQGSYMVDFNASGMASGVYFYRLETPGYSDVKKMILVK